MYVYPQKRIAQQVLLFMIMLKTVKKWENVKKPVKPPEIISSRIVLQRAVLTLLLWCPWGISHMKRIFRTFLGIVM